jgi:ABC-type amino acid transport substrate-binding protein
VDFSNPYLPVQTALIAPSGSLPEVSHAIALQGKRVGAISGSTGESWVGELKNEVADLEGRTDFPSNEELFEALLDEPPAIDAAVTDITHYWDLKKRTNVVLVAPMGPEQGLAFVFPEGSPLRDRVNAFLEEFLHSRSYFSMVRRYFGEEATEMIRSARLE